MDKAEQRVMRRIGGHLQSAPGAAIVVGHGIIPAEPHLNHQQRMKNYKLIRGLPDHPLAILAKVEIRDTRDKEGWTVGKQRVKAKRGVLKGV